MSEKKAKLKKNTFMRCVIIRIAMKNVVSKDYPKLGLKAGDVMEYTLSDIVDIIDQWLKVKNFSYYMIVHNRGEDNEHVHIVISFNDDSKCRFSTVKNKFPFGDIEPCLHGVRACVRYLTHCDHPEKTQYNWSDIITNNNPKLDQYKEQSAYSEKKYVEKLVNKISKGELKECDFTSVIEPKIYVKYKSVFKAAVDYYIRGLDTNPNHEISVILLQGPPRVGKSLFCQVWANENGKSIRFSSASRDPWQDYRQEDVFVLDDYNYNTVCIEDLLKNLDPHVNTSNSSRYNNKLFVGDTLFLCSNIPILLWYPEEDTEEREALFKRINCVLDFQDYKKKSMCRNNDYVYYFNRKTGKYEVGIFSENDNERLLKDRVASYTVNRIMKVEDIEDKEKAIICKDTQIMSQGYTLVSVDDEVHHFDLKKYIDVKADEEKEKNFLNSISTL